MNPIAPPSSPRPPARDPRPRCGARTRVGSLLLLVAVAAAGCGIDDQSQPGDVVDIAGTWEGEFVSNEDGLSVPITQLVIIQADTDRFTFDFDVSIFSSPFNPSAVAINTALEQTEADGILNPDRTIFIRFGQDEELVMNGRVATDGNRIRGSWLLDVQLVEDSGTWDVRRIDRLR